MLQFDDYCTRYKQSLYEDYYQRKSYTKQTFDMFCRIEYEKYSELASIPRHTLVLDNKKVMRSTALGCTMIVNQVAGRYPTTKIKIIKG